MGKRNDEDLRAMVDDLVADAGSDRNRLITFLDDLISNYGGENAAGIAEYVAKLIEASTRQQQVRVAIIKTMATKKDDGEDDSDEEADDAKDIAAKLGTPFEALDEGSN